MTSTVKFVPSDKGLVKFLEEEQNNVVLFSFAQRTEWDDTFKQVHHFVKCRDFLGDVIYANWTKENQMIYHFYVNVEEDIPDSDNTLLFVNKDIDFEIDLCLLHELEELNGFKLTKVVKTDRKDTYLFIGDKKWQSSIFLISFYSLMLKVIMICPEDSWKGTFEWFKKNYCKETFYAKTLEKNFENIRKNLYQFVIEEGKDPSGFKEKQTLSLVHNYSGWISIVCGRSEHENHLADIWTRILSDTNPVPVAEKPVETEKEIIWEFGTIITIASHVDSLEDLTIMLAKYSDMGIYKGPSLMVHDDYIVPEQIKPKKEKTKSSKGKKKKPDPFYHALFQKALKAGLNGLV